MRSGPPKLLQDLPCLIGPLPTPHTPCRSLSHFPTFPLPAALPPDLTSYPCAPPAQAFPTLAMPVVTHTLPACLHGPLLPAVLPFIYLPRLPCLPVSHLYPVHMPCAGLSPSHYYSYVQQEGPAFALWTCAPFIACQPLIYHTLVPAHCSAHSRLFFLLVALPLFLLHPCLLPCLDVACGPACGSWFLYPSSFALCLCLTSGLPPLHYTCCLHAATFASVAVLPTLTYPTYPPHPSSFYHTLACLPISLICMSFVPGCSHQFFLLSLPTQVLLCARCLTTTILLCLPAVPMTFPLPSFLHPYGFHLYIPFYYCYAWRAFSSCITVSLYQLGTGPSLRLCLPLPCCLAFHIHWVPCPMVLFLIVPHLPFLLPALYILCLLAACNLSLRIDSPCDLGIPVGRDGLLCITPCPPFCWGRCGVEVGGRPYMPSLHYAPAAYLGGGRSILLSHSCLGEEEACPACPALVCAYHPLPAMPAAFMGFYLHLLYPTCPYPPLLLPPWDDRHYCAQMVTFCPSPPTSCLMPGGTFC